MRGMHSASAHRAVLLRAGAGAGGAAAGRAVAPHARTGAHVAAARPCEPVEPMLPGLLPPMPVPGGWLAMPEPVLPLEGGATPVPLLMPCAAAVPAASARARARREVRIGMRWCPLFGMRSAGCDRARATAGPCRRSRPGGPVVDAGSGRRATPPIGGRPGRTARRPVPAFRLGIRTGLHANCARCRPVVTERRLSPPGRRWRGS